MNRSNKLEIVIFVFLFVYKAFNQSTLSKGEDNTILFQTQRTIPKVALCVPEGPQVLPESLPGVPEDPQGLHKALRVPNVYL